MPTTRPLRFYSAQAIKSFTMNDGVVAAGQMLFVARWKGLYVLARNANSYFVTTAEKAAEYARTMRLTGRKLMVAENPPVIRPVGPQFEWHVEAGTTDADNCDENTTFSELVTDLAAAQTLVQTLKTTRFTNPTRHFLRIRGPAFYSYERPPVPPPPPPAPRPQPRATRPLENVYGRIGMNRDRYYNSPTENGLNDYNYASPRATASREEFVRHLRELNSYVEQDRINRGAR